MISRSARLFLTGLLKSHPKGFGLGGGGEVGLGVGAASVLSPAEAANWTSEPRCRAEEAAVVVVGRWGLASRGGRQDRGRGWAACATHVWGYRSIVTPIRHLDQDRHQDRFFFCCLYQKRHF